LFKENIA